MQYFGNVDKDRDSFKLFIINNKIIYFGPITSIVLQKLKDHYKIKISIIQSDRIQYFKK